jgi:excisionase family DNA binding protein
MSEFNEFTFDRLLELLAEKLASRITLDGTGLSPRLLTIDQAAVYVGRSREATQHLVASGKLPTVRSDRRVFIDRQDLDHWIEQHKERTD